MLAIGCVLVVERGQILINREARLESGDLTGVRGRRRFVSQPSPMFLAGYGISKFTGPP